MNYDDLFQELHAWILSDCDTCRAGRVYFMFGSVSFCLVVVIFLFGSKTILALLSGCAGMLLGVALGKVRSAAINEKHASELTQLQRRIVDLQNLAGDKSCE